MGMWRIIMISLWLLGMSGVMQAQSYEHLWQRVEQLEKDDLPKSVVEAARTIYVKAEKEKNVPQMMKAFLTMTVYREVVSPDSLQVDVRKLEDWISSPKISMQDKAVLSSILGEMIIRQNYEKGDSCLKQSLKDSVALITYDAGKFVPLVKVGETSLRYFNDNLYDLLARRAIQLWKQNRWRTSQQKVESSINQTYQSLLSFYQEMGNRSAWLLTALDAFPNADEAQLREWIKEYGDVEVCAEVYLRLADWLQQKDELVKCVDLLREGIARYPNYERVAALKNKEQEILFPRVSLSVEFAYPAEPMKIRVDYRNLKGLTLYIYRLNLGADSDLLSKVNTKTVLQYGSLLKKKHVDLPATSDYRNRTEWVSLDAPEAGIYYLVAQSDENKKIKGGTLLQLTSLLLAERGLPVDRQEIIVLDKKSGQPVPGSKVAFYDRKGEGFVLKETYTADKNGTIMLSGKGNSSVYGHAFSDQDKAMPIQWFRFTRERYVNFKDVVECVNLFTDRSLYRPGQRVYYSGIAYYQQKDSLRVKKEGTFSLCLLDANNREITRQEVRVDDFGTFQGTFELPLSGMLGVYRIRTDKGEVTFRVEEYKRPTFEITFDTLRNAYQAGDSVFVKGVARTFAGAVLQGEKVNYQIIQQKNGYWRMRGITVQQVVGETTTDNQGRFEIPVHISQVKDEEANWFFNYEIKVEVTNLSGETQSNVLNLPLANSSLLLFIPRWDNEIIANEQKKTLKIVVENLKGVPVMTNVDCRVYSMKEKAKWEWEREKCVWQGKFESNKEFIPEELYKLPSGSYQLSASVCDEKGRKQEKSVRFTLFSTQDKRLPYKTDIWCTQSGTSFDEDGTATLSFGSSEKDVCLFYDVYTANRWVESKRIFFSDSLLTFRYNYREAYGDGLRVSLMFAKNGQMYARYIEFKKPEPEKTLQLKWKTFRDKLKPGNQETWTLLVLRKDGKPADAQLMATLYDASLDRLYPHAWSVKQTFSRYLPTYNWYGSRERERYWGFVFPLKRYSLPLFSYSSLEIPGMKGSRSVRMYKSNALLSSGGITEVKYVPPMEDGEEMDRIVEEGDIPLNQESRIQPRSNFAETAFFYPQLRTNAQGEVEIAFTLPESLTEWKFMGLAHTQDMDYGQLNATVTASKDFMLQSNLPRFVRVGDEASFSASLVNLTEKEIKGTVRMELFNPETDKVYKVQKKSFKVGAEATVAVAFPLVVKEEYGVLACRMIAEGNGFSDGEQRYLPVLTNKQWMTESVSIDVDSVGVYRISLNELFNQHSKTATHPRMVVEYTGNPIWYAVQALPVLAEPEHENAYSWAAAYYANTLAGYIARSNPRIRQAMESWSAQPKDNEMLLSALQKNEELKNVLLEETPWVSDAMNETEQKQRLSTLFDEKTLNYRHASCVAKLVEMQQENGAWSWYKGMTGNRYMTTQITELLARLQSLQGKALEGKNLKIAYRKAFCYLKEQVHQEYEELKEAEKRGDKSLIVSEQTLRYLYICAIDGTLQPEKQVNDYFIDKLEGMSASLTIYGKSLAAIVLKQHGRTKKSEEFMQSVMEYSVMTEQMGRYFDTPKASYSWFSYKIPTEVAAMEAFSRLMNDDKVVEQMKRWLLKQKQTQSWETPIATVDAIYALLCSGKPALTNDGTARIVVGKETLKVSGDNAWGYLKQLVEGEVMKIKDIIVQKESSGMAWGAVYAQFLEELEKGESHSNALAVSRTLYKEGKPISGEALTVGDRITVRLTVSSDREMDFVQLKDERAACMEPVDVLSGYHWQKDVGYYQVTRDASTSFFVDKLRKGTHVFEYEVYITSPGEYKLGLGTVQSVYAPEMTAHTAGGRLCVN